MAHMKDFDRRIRQGGDDAIAALSEYVESLHNELARQSRLMHDARIMLVGSPVGSGCCEAFRLLNEEPSPWIPVSERLPEEGEQVIVWMPDCPHHPCGMDMGSCMTDSWGVSWMVSGGRSAFPTHWMPLPEPPAA